MHAQDNEVALNGAYTFEEFSKTAHEDWYSKNYAPYAINKKALSKLKKNYSELKALAFLGSWCTDTHDHFPVFMKVWKEMGLNPADVNLVFVGLDKKINAEEYQDFELEYLPTFFIFDKEKNLIGKIVETPKKSIELDFLELLEN